MLSKLLTLSAIGLASASRFFVEDIDHLRFMWEGWKADHGKTYKLAENEHRFQVFVSNLKLADERNAEQVAAGGEEVHGMTRFADLTQDEFEAQFLGSDESMAMGAQESDLSLSTPIVNAIVQDWTGIYTTPVKNQGNCGSCWAFSATEQIESDTMRTKGVSYTLSPQQVTSCTTTCYGCDGGWTERAYTYVKNYGIEQESAYPYTSGTTGVTGSCNYNSAATKVGLTTYYTITGETNMANYVGATGPLSVCLCASTWSTYTGGIMYSCPTQVNHCVQAVGVNTGTGGYWKVRNSWGTGWGESGYIRLAYGQNTCAITNDPTYTVVFLK
jgi:C1A family cysteine protease